MAGRQNHSIDLGLKAALLGNNVFTNGDHAGSRHIIITMIIMTKIINLGLKATLLMTEITTLAPLLPSLVSSLPSWHRK